MAGRDALRRRWEANHDEMAQFGDIVFDPEVEEAVISMARRYLGIYERLAQVGKATTLTEAA